MHPVLVEAVHKHYRQSGEDVPALRGVDLAVHPARLLAIMGASGSGKSTLLHLMAGLARPDEGRVLVSGQNMAAMGDRKLTLFRRSNIGLVFQAFNLVPTLSARENVLLPLQLGGRPSNVDQRRVDELLESLGLTGRANHRPDALSGGEQQRVAIARALVAQPAVILADEPTGNLDSHNSQAVCTLLRTLAEQQGKAVVVVTHEPSVAIYAHEVLMLRDGRVLDRFDVPPGTDAATLATRYQQTLAAA